MWVDTDGTNGLLQAVRYLVELGHQRIAMIAWPEDSLTGGYRLHGYLQGLAEAGIPANPAYVVRCEHDEQTGRQAMTQLLKLPREQQPTAVVTVSDLVAIGAMDAAEQHGLVVGRDISIIGFDDAPMSRYLRPSLTTLRQPIPEIGQTIVSMLEDVLSRNEPQQRHHLIEPTLVIRASCAPPKE
jgi:DNA-binding LacI/PurR family transcriptional regulator